MPELSVEGLYFLQLGPFAFDLPAATLTALSGPSGAGKSRLLRALADLDPHQGRIRLDGIEQCRIPAPRWRREVGLLPAEPRFWLATGREHLSAAAPQWQQALGLSDQLLTQPIKRLSSGERQRLGLLRLLVLQPKVLLLDEPTANLDGDATAAVERLICEYAEDQQAAVLWVGHDPEQIRHLCSRQLHLQDGRLENRR